MTRNLCDIRLGWSSCFYGDKLIVSHINYPPYIIKVCDIARGELLPPSDWIVLYG